MFSNFFQMQKYKILFFGKLTEGELPHSNWIVFRFVIGGTEIIFSLNLHFLDDQAKKFKLHLRLFAQITQSKQQKMSSLNKHLELNYFLRCCIIWLEMFERNEAISLEILKFSRIFL